MDMPTDVNLKIAVRHMILHDQKEKHEKLLKTLSMQLDKASSQNKNNYLMAFMSLLVSWKLFDDVQAALLPKGHSYEDTDQMFSCFAFYNRYHNAMTVEELLKNCNWTYQKPVPIVVVLESQANINDRLNLLEKEGLFRKMKNLTVPSAFRFQRKIFDVKEMRTCFLKGLSCKEDWRAHFTDNNSENHVFIDDAVTSDIFLDFDRMLDFLTKPIPEDEISNTVKNINDCLKNEGLFSEWQAKNATMVVMGMADEFSILF